MSNKYLKINDQYHREVDIKSFEAKRDYYLWLNDKPEIFEVDDLKSYQPQNNKWFNPTTYALIRGCMHKNPTLWEKIPTIPDIGDYIGEDGRRVIDRFILKNSVVLISEDLYGYIYDSSTSKEEV